MAGDEELKGLLLKRITNYDNYELGCGGYGRVYAVDYCGTTCAAKEIHSALVEEMGDDEIRGTMESCVKECQQWSKLRHPNVVQFLGVYFPDGGGATSSLRLPILVMEMMSENLPSFLNKYQPIPVHIKFSITHDISLGLCYLHSHDPPMAHRYLSSNSILLTVHHVAKISDLGVDKAIKADRKNMKAKSPGVADFMSPESFTKSPWPWLNQAFDKGLRSMWPMSTAGIGGFGRLVKAHSQYGLSMDVFSFAGIILHIFTQQWPIPTELVESDHKTEAERRQKYLDKMKEDAEDLRPLVVECLDNDPTTRPTIAVVCEKIQSIKDVCESPPPNITLYIQRTELKSENELLKQQMVQLTTKERKQESVDLEALMKEKEVLQAELKATQLKVDTLQLQKNIAESKLVHMEKEKMMVDLEIKEIISRHKTEVTEKTARLSQAEERLVITTTKLDQNKQENKDLRANLQSALDQTEALQKGSQDLHVQVLELQQTLDREKQLKTEAINKLVKVSFSKPKEQVSSADILKKDREIHKLRGELQKESEKSKKMIEKYQDEIAAIQSRITEEQQQRQDLEVKYALCEQENTQLRKELMTTPYVTLGPQIDLDQIPEEPATDASDNSTNNTDSCDADVKDVSWVSIPAGTNTQEHGWRDVFVVLHYTNKTLSFFEQEEGSSVSENALFSFEFSQIRHVKDFDSGEHTQVFVDKENIKHLLRFSYTAAIKDDFEQSHQLMETAINVSGHFFTDVTVRSPHECAMCALPLNWNIGQPGHQASHPIECKRCHLQCHDYHVLLSGDSMSPCTGPTSPLINPSFLQGDRDSKTFYMLTKSEEDKDHWYGQLYRITQTKRESRRFSVLNKYTTL